MPFFAPFDLTFWPVRHQNNRNAEQLTVNNSMKKIALKMLVLVMALAVSQTTWADKKSKSDNEKGKPNTEHRGFGYGRQNKGDKPFPGMGHRGGKPQGMDQAKWDSIKAAHQGMHKGFDKAKWDSIKAAHQGQHKGFDKTKWDSIRAAHQGQHKGFDKAKWDSIKAAHPELAAKLDSMKNAHGPKGHGFGRHFGMRPPFGPHRGFGPHNGWKHHKTTTEEETVATEDAAKAPATDATAIRETLQTTEAPTYDLNGRKANVQKGKSVIIRNGKKYVR